MPKRCRIKIEVPCRECQETGKQDEHLCDYRDPIPGFTCLGAGQCGEVQTVRCSECDGLGWVEEYVYANYEQLTKATEGSFYEQPKPKG